MPIKHEKGVLSTHQDLFYFNASEESWYRLLVRGGKQQGYLKEISIRLTPPIGFLVIEDVLEISKEFIYMREPTIKNTDDIYTHVLPTREYEHLSVNVGEVLTKKLLDFNYIANMNLDKLAQTEEGEYFNKLELDKQQNVPVKMLIQTQSKLYNPPKPENYSHAQAKSGRFSFS